MNTQIEQLEKIVVISGLKEAALVLNGLAASLKDERAAQKTMTLVTCVVQAVKMLEGK